MAYQTNLDLSNGNIYRVSIDNSCLDLIQTSWTETVNQNSLQDSSCVRSENLKIENCQDVWIGRKSFLSLYMMDFNARVISTLSPPSMFSTSSSQWQFLLTLLNKTLFFQSLQSSFIYINKYISKTIRIQIEKRANSITQTYMHGFELYPSLMMTN